MSEEKPMMQKEGKEKKRIEVPFYTKTGLKKGNVALPKEIFGIKPNLKLIAQAVRVHLINSRQGTRSVKGRGDLHYSSRKLYRQKGTGGARHGDRTAAGFRKGAKAHGPKPKDFNALLPEKMKNIAILSGFSLLAREKRVKIIEELVFSKPKLTKKAVKLLEKIGFNKGLIIYEEDDKNLVLAVRNIPGYSYQLAKAVSAYDVNSASQLLITKKALESLKNRFLIKSIK